MSAPPPSRQPRVASRQFRYERVNSANRVVLTDEVVKTLRQQRHLLSILAFYESRPMSSAARYVQQLYGSVRRGVRGSSQRLGRGQVPTAPCFQEVRSATGRSRRRVGSEKANRPLRVGSASPANNEAIVGAARAWFARRVTEVLHIEVTQTWPVAKPDDCLVAASVRSLGFGA